MSRDRLACMFRRRPADDAHDSRALITIKTTRQQETRQEYFLGHGEPEPAALRVMPAPSARRSLSQPSRECQEPSDSPIGAHALTHCADGELELRWDVLVDFLDDQFIPPDVPDDAVSD